MALKKLLSQLRQNVLGSSSAVRSVNTNGIWTSLHKSGMLQHAEDFSAPLNHALQSDFHTLRPDGKCGIRRAIITGDQMKNLTLSRARTTIYQSHVCLAIRQGGTGETLALLPGTIIRADGIVATSANLLSSLNSRELKERVDVMVLGTQETCKGVLLDADFCSNIAFVKMLSRRQQKVAKLGKLDDLRPGSTAVAAGCHVQHGILRNAKSHYSCGFFGSIGNARTSGRFIKAAVSEKGLVVGGPLIDPNVGVLGVVNSRGCQIEATPIDDVLKYLEHLEKHGLPCHLQGATT